MACKDCEKKPVITLSESQRMCKRHFLKYFESKFWKTIKKYNLIEKQDVVAVAISGGKDSLTTLHIIKESLKKQKQNVLAILIDEGIKGYREKTIKDAQNFCKKERIKLFVVSFKNEFGKTLDQILKENKDQNPCTICGVFRRNLLNKKAMELKITKLATGHNLDDEAQSYLMNQLRVNWKRSAGLGPISGANTPSKKRLFAQRIKPLYFLSEKEVATYSFLMGFNIHYTECPYAAQSFRHDVRDSLNELEKNHPGSKHALVNSLMQILPTLKEKFISENSFGYCKNCKEPASKQLCNSCLLMEKLKLKEETSKTKKIKRQK